MRVKRKQRKIGAVREPPFAYGRPGGKEEDLNERATSEESSVVQPEGKAPAETAS